MDVHLCPDSVSGNIFSHDLQDRAARATFFANLSATTQAHSTLLLWVCRQAGSLRNTAPSGNRQASRDRYYIWVQTPDYSIADSEKVLQRPCSFDLLSVHLKALLLTRHGDRGMETVYAPALVQTRCWTCPLRWNAASSFNTRSFVSAVIGRVGK